MKTKEEILKHLQEVGYSSKQRVKISAYLLGKGIEIDTKDIKKGDNKFEDFLEWLKAYRKEYTEKFYNDIKKLIDDFILEQPQFKVGDWIRDKETNHVMQIEYIDTNYLTYYSGISYIFGDYAIKYEPKEGEFFYMRSKDNDEYYFIGCKDNIANKNDKVLHISFLIDDIMSLYSDNFCIKKERISILRPATEEEIQLLKDKVKEKCNKEFNGKEWVDIKKSDKELFEKWKKEYFSAYLVNWTPNPIECQNGYDKLKSYIELYKFSQWVNQFYKEDGYVFILNIKNNNIAMAKVYEGLKCGEILFNSKESAQRAIDCLGVDLIKKALTFKNK